MQIIGSLEEGEVTRKCVERRGSESFGDEGESLTEIGGARNTELERVGNQGSSQSPRSYEGEFQG